MIAKYANPTRFLQLADKFLPVLNALCALLLVTGLYFALYASPPDYQQGITVRIMYIHVPAAWASLFIYTVMAASSFVFLVWKHAMADLLARASAPIGLWMALLTLLTGSLWGKPMWGTWWEWDARMTSMLVLFFLYVGYWLLSLNANHDNSTQKSCAVIALVGFINIPIIKFSVEWWSTLHQPASMFRMSGSAIDPSMQVPLLLMASAFTLYYASVVLYRVRILYNKTRLERSQLRRSA